MERPGRRAGTLPALSFPLHFGVSWCRSIPAYGGSSGTSVILLYTSDMKVTARFNVTGWDSATYDQPSEGPDLSRVTIRKAFEGDLEGESTGEGLFCGMSDPDAGAGYVVSERFEGRLGDRKGSFVMQHGGVMGPGMAPRTFGHVVPGSGTGDLAGLTGTVEISQAGGDHSLTLDYDLPTATASDAGR